MPSEVSGFPVPSPTSNPDAPLSQPQFWATTSTVPPTGLYFSTYHERHIGGNISPLPPHFLRGTPTFTLLTLSLSPLLFRFPWTIVAPKRTFKQESDQCIRRKLIIQAPLPPSFVRICHEAGITIPCEVVDGSVLLGDKDAISQLSSADRLESGSRPFPGHWLGGTPP
jgi:hypothetical protein